MSQWFYQFLTESPLPLTSSFWSASARLPFLTRLSFPSLWGLGLVFPCFLSCRVNAERKAPKLLLRLSGLDFFWPLTSLWERTFDGGPGERSPSRLWADTVELRGSEAFSFEGFGDWLSLRQKALRVPLGFLLGGWLAWGRVLAFCECWGGVMQAMLTKLLQGRLMESSGLGLQWKITISNCNELNNIIYPFSLEAIVCEQLYHLIYYNYYTIETRIAEYRVCITEKLKKLCSSERYTQKKTVLYGTDNEYVEVTFWKFKNIVSSRVKSIQNETFNVHDRQVLEK